MPENPESGKLVITIELKDGEFISDSVAEGELSLCSVIRLFANGIGLCTKAMRNLADEQNPDDPDMSELIMSDFINETSKAMEDNENDTSRLILKKLE